VEQVGILPAALLAVQVQLERRTAGVDAALQRIAQRLPERGDPVIGQARDRPQPEDLGFPQRVLDIDVADAGWARAGAPDRCAR
jgi:hypothetical protein